MMNARSAIAATLAVLALSGASFALGVSPALAEFKSIGSFGKSAPVGGLLEEPHGVAVESSSGDVFVVSGAGADEQQTVNLSGATGGKFTLSFKGQTTSELLFGSNEKQMVTLKAATSGDFTVKFQGQTTAAIPFNATAAVVQGALEGLSSIGSGNVSVSGAAGGPYTVEFKGSLGFTSVEEMTCDGSALNGGASCTVATTVMASGNASEGEVQSALESLSTIGRGNVEVGGSGSKGEYTVEFKGSLGYTNVEEMTCAGSGRTCTVATTVNGFTTRRVVKYNAGGTAVLGEFTGAGTPQNGFGENFGVAVDNSTSACKGDVYVNAGEEYIDRFKPKGSAGNEPNEYTFASPQLEASSGTNTRGVAVDSSGNLYAALWSHREGVSKFACEGTEPTLIDENEKTIFESSVALDSAGDVYVVHEFAFGEGGYVVKFNSSGELQPEPELETEGKAAVAVTVDQATGEVFVLDATPEYHVTRYSSTGTKLEEFGAGEIGEAWGIAYSTQGSGRIYVTEKTNNAVQIFESGTATVGKPEISVCTATVQTPVVELFSCMLTPNGEALARFDYREVKVGALSAETTPRTVTSAGRFEEEVQGLKPATEYTFELVARNNAGTETGEKVSFKTAPAVVVLKPCAGGDVEAESATLGGSTLETIGGVEAKWRFDYGLTTEYGLETAEQSSTSFPALPEAPVAGLEPNAEYHCRLVASDEYGTTPGEDGTFKTLAVPPLAGGEPASFIAAHAANLVARVDPENSATSFHFEYGQSASYGQQTPEEAAGSGLGETYVRQRIEGLAGSTVYHFRVVATNEQAMTVYGPDETFTTGTEGIPVVQTGAASEVSQIGASISGTVDPEGIQTSYAFEVGTDTSYSGAEIYGNAGQGEGAEPIIVGLEDLAPATTYHYRLTATNADGTSYGQDMTFTTSSFPSPILQPLTPPLLATSLIVFPTESGTTTTNTTKALTRAQKLAKALKVCRKYRSKKKQVACEKRAQERYGPAKKAKRKAGKK